MTRFLFILLLLFSSCLSLNRFIDKPGFYVVVAVKTYNLDFETIVKNVRDDLGIPVQIVFIKDSGKNNLKQFEKINRNFLDFIVGVCDDSISDGKIGSIWIDRRIAIINIKSIVCEDSKKFERRIEKEIVFLFGRLLKLDICPNFTCALYEVHSLEELDRKGRNYCPPCMSKYYKVLQEYGFPMEQE